MKKHILPFLLCLMLCFCTVGCSFGSSGGNWSSGNNGNSEPQYGHVAHTVSLSTSNYARFLLVRYTFTREYKYNSEYVFDVVYYISISSRDTSCKYSDCSLTFFSKTCTLDSFGNGYLVAVHAYQPWTIDPNEPVPTVVTGRVTYYNFEKLD